ncbi:MAG: response regulator [Nitrospinota bacterium]
MSFKLEKEKGIGSGKKALIVDDHAAMRMLMANVCTELGYKTQRAGNGLQALDIIVSGGEQIDLMLLDWNMPLMPGISVVEELAETKEQDPSLDLPLILLVTGQNFESEIVRAGENMGLIGGYLLKPVRAQTVSNKIRRAQDKHSRLKKIENLKRLGEEEFGPDHVNRYDEAIKECFNQDKRINEQGFKDAEAKRNGLIKQMENRLSEAKKGNQKFNSIEEKGKFLEKLVALREGGFSPSPVIWPLLEAARLMEEVGDQVGALKLLDEIQEEKVSAWVLSEKGKIHEKQKNYLMAIKEYREAVLLNPKFLYARDRLSALLEKKGKLDEALDIVKEAVSISPDTPGRRRSEGEISMRLERFGDAENAFKHILEVEKAKNSARNNINMGRSLLAQPEKVASAARYLNAAERVIERRIEKTTSGIKRDLHFNYGDFFIKSGNIKKGEKHIQYGKEKIANDGSEKEEEILSRAAEVYLKNDLVDKAKEVLSEILDEDPKNKGRQKAVQDTLKKFRKENVADEMIQSALQKADEAILKANDENLRRRKSASKLLEAGKFVEAEALFMEALEEYKQLLKKYKSDEGLLFNKGVLLSQMINALGKNMGENKIVELKYERDTLFRAAYQIDPVRISDGLAKIGIPREELGL